MLAKKAVLAAFILVSMVAGQLIPWDFARVEAATTVSDISLAEYWAPVWYQDTDDDDADADFITSFDFDGNWIGSDNWENQPYHPLRAYIYYWVVETESHWFIGYADFHPRDWSDLGMGEHENDLEGVLLVIKKDGSTYGQFLLMITVAHLNFYSYQDEDASPSKDVTRGHEDLEGDVQFYQSHHPYVYVEANGHGVYGDKRWETDDFPGGDGVVYYYTGTAEEPDKGNDRNVTYALRSMDQLWERRYDYQDTFSSFGTFRGDTHGENKANTPWGWDDHNDGKVYPPDLFMDPAYLVDYYHSGLGPFSDKYIYRSCGGIIGSFHPYRNNYERTWTWKAEGASEIRVHFTKIEITTGDYIYFYDKDGNQVGESITGSHTDYWSPYVTGNTISIRMSTDRSNTDWGFYADQYEIIQYTPPPEQEPEGVTYYYIMILVVSAVVAIAASTIYVRHRRRAVIQKSAREKVVKRESAHDMES